MSLEREDGEGADEREPERTRSARPGAREPVVEEWASDDELLEEDGRAPWLNMRRVAWLGLVLATIIALSVFWSACEQRYQSCLAKVEAKYSGTSDNLTNFVRRQEADSCSRSPF